MYLVALVCVFGLSSAVPISQYGPSVAVPRVIDGIIAAEGAWPAQLSLQRMRAEGWGHTCGATLLNENYALTAAHCVDSVAPSERLIQAGVNNRDDSRGQILTLSRITMHENYIVGFGFPNDIAVVRFTNPIQMGDKVQPGLLPQPGEDFVDAECLITGWGRMDSGSTIPNELRQGAVSVLSKSECSSRLSYIRDSHICIFDRSGVHGACNGDSGGPINCRSSPSAPFKQVGVASWVMASNGNCLVSFPSVYGRVTYFLDWITANTP